MYYRIIAKNSDGTEAFAERLRTIRLIDHDECYVVSVMGTAYYCHVSELVLNPEVIREGAGGWLCRIRLEADHEEED